MHGTVSSFNSSIKSIQKVALDFMIRLLYMEEKDRKRKNKRICSQGSVFFFFFGVVISYVSYEYRAHKAQMISSANQICNTWHYSNSLGLVLPKSLTSKIDGV